jgi:hypothetical protein
MNVTMFRRSKSQILSFTKIQGKQIGIKPSIYIFEDLIKICFDTYLNQ